MSEPINPATSSWHSRLTRPLTPAEHRRMRIGLALMPVIGWIFAVWSTYAYEMSTSGHLDRLGHIKGHDFVHFYMLGGIALDRASQDLFDWHAQSARTDRIVPEYEVRYLPIHSPQVAMFFAPFAKLPYMVAASIWIVLSLAVYGLCCAVLWKIRPDLRPYPGLVALTSLALPALYGLIAAGQTSSFALLWFTLAYLALRADRQWLAGLCLGTLAYKPTLVMVFPLLFLFAGQWRTLIAMALAAGLQFAIGGMYFGWPTLVDYVRTLGAGVSAIDQLESQPWQMHSLRALFANTLPWPSLAFALQVVSSLAVIVFAIRVWRSSEPLSLRYAILIIATVLVNPHVYTYELVILVPAYLIAAEMAVEQPPDRRMLWPTLFAAVYLPGLSLFMESTYLQWSVLAIAWLMIVLWNRRIRHPGPQRAQEAVA